MHKDIKIFGGRYGLGSKEFKPRDVAAIVRDMKLGELRHNFTVGINDDLTGLSLKTDPLFANDDAGYRSAILYGIGSDGTVGAVKNIVKIVGENSELFPQSYAVYDSKKSGGLTASHLRFAPDHIRSQYLVEYADFISVSNFIIARRFDVFRGLRPGGTVMINTGIAPADAFAMLPRSAAEHLIRMRARVYFLDANRAAAELGLGSRTNTFIMLNFFNLTKIIDPAVAAGSAKDAIEKTYKKKGMDIVAANWAAVDRAVEFLIEFRLPSAPAADAPDFIPAMIGAPVGIAATLGEMAAMRGDDLPVSVFQNYGEFPVGTARYEKRAMAAHVAAVDLDKCIQCGKCSMLCPHAAIRINAVDSDKVKSEKLKVKFVDMKTPELGQDARFTLNISPADCTGCKVCVGNCPVSALRMIPINEADQAAFDDAADLPEFPREKLNLNIPKHIELLPHYFEFPGACAGCGETPYIKLLAHLFGDKMVVANATGCSSIYGGNLPTTPWRADSRGCGPAWSNSLFEDNAEYGLGMRLALNQKKAFLETLEKSENKNQKMLDSMADAATDKSVWIIGGDGWAYDIGYGGLDHVLHSGENVNVLVLDTEGYSNTGGQSSKSTPFGASMKFAVGGKEHAKKDLGLIAMMSGAYVAQIALGANQVQAIRAFREAESFDGPSIILAYSPCISHGFDLKNSVAHQQSIVNSGAWPLFRFHPETGLSMDSSGADAAAFAEFIKSENRFAAAAAVNKNFDKLVASASKNNDYRRELKQHIANFAMREKDS
ncbi:MAG: 2-oxoacid:acceptor oxidoreductase family protein [Rickettsiales bacterium]|jgi:pyruvate-ferredoxin/flavodoxin oxidoreductase|nr:2-oxoacid:acceptor oxidoreductase family protein [Rickettsiales bacterium]